MDTNITCYREVRFLREYEIGLDGSPTGKWNYTGEVVPGRNVTVFGAFEGESLVWTPPPENWQYQPVYIPYAPNYPPFYIEYLR